MGLSDIWTQWRTRDGDSDIRHGDRASPEFTAKAVVIGLAIGCLLCFTNLYFGLQTGWISMMSLQSALIGFLISRLLPVPLSAQELIVVQTTAVATGTMPLAAGFVGILPALGLLDEERDGVPPIHLSWWNAIAWSLSVAFFGVFLSPPIRKQVIIEEKLAFPSGTATAQLISVLHKLPPPDIEGPHRRRGYQHVDAEEPTSVVTDSTMIEEEEDADEQTPLNGVSSTVQNDGWRTLIWSFFTSSALTLFGYFFPVTFALPLFGSSLAKNWLWFFTPSLSYVGQGIIMGFPTTLSMNLGMFVGWAILTPISKYNGWAPGPVGDMTSGARGWILWISLAIMCTDSLVSLLPVVYEYCVDIYARVTSDSGVRSESGVSSKETAETETPDRLVPYSWVLWGLGASVVFGTLLVWAVFGHDGIKPWATVLGFALGGLLSVLGVRALGETDLNPVSGLGKISQLVFAWVQPGNIVANIIAGGVAEAGAQQAGDLMQDLKTGHLCGASPRAQFYGQLIGSTVSILVTTTAFSLYTRAYEIPGPSFPAPTAYVWLSLARLLRDGTLPERSGVFMLAFGLFFAAVAAVKTYAARSQAPWAKWVPSGVAFAIGFLNTPSFSIARLIGGVIEHVYRTRYARGRDDIWLIVVASGFVLGRAWTCGVGVASCWGCGHGMCVRTNEE
ncbi:OPT oligopeptide transporter protein-domain-containing protein [Schizophyllum amplum]|uniref:OPT oligopeptide transporter protein-domain-containing protein n=1 Tax=Schizophyllum amplum TaxID=97359 RepID=A0A550CHE4_9AGAR|nr:OPT oligopeptide transporter protein-domain-containing protein [Auriculariopsis ampla]